jgi:hypothetical protein
VKVKELVILLMFLMDKAACGGAISFKRVRLMKRSFT